MILYMKYDEENEKYSMFEGTAEARAYSLNVEVPDGSKVSLIEGKPQIEEGVPYTIEGDPIDFFIKKLASYEEAYLFDGYFTFLFDKETNKFVEKERPKLKMCSICGRICEETYKDMCVDCFTQKELPEILKKIYKNLGDDYSSYESLSKILDFIEQVKREKFYGVNKINEKIETFVTSLFEKEHLPMEGVLPL